MVCSAPHRSSFSRPDRVEGSGSPPESKISMDGKAVGSVVAQCLKPHGFKRKTTSWYRQFPEVTQVVNLQRSPWGPQYYINLGVALRALLDDPNPKENHCHARARIERAGADPDETKSVFDLEFPVSDEERAIQIRSILDHGVQWLDRMRSEAEVKAAISASLRLQNSTPVVARRHLGLE